MNALWLWGVKKKALTTRMRFCRMSLSSINTFAALSAKMNIKSYKKIDWIYDMNLIAKWKKEKQLVDQN